MRIGLVGLGRMGANMAQRLLNTGHEVVASDIDRGALQRAVELGAEPADSLAAVVAALEAPRVVWVMVPAGGITAETIASLADLMSPGDTIIDGGNSRFTDTMTRAGELAESGINLVDAGTSGGIWGLEEGYCLMVGADREVFARIEPILASLAPPDGYAHVGATGAGHFVKMVHNGIEYAMMQAYGEGFQLLDASGFDLDLPQIAELWRHGSVVRSWLLDLAGRALAEDPRLDAVSGYVEDSGEGRWTVESAIDLGVPAPTIALSLFSRFASRQPDMLSNRLLAALRQQFGGHAVRSSDVGDE
ncbi:MAG TPA: decarboxylating 6-phosphogluconate dehydrogenase [Egibacteraceae bacterium]|nr:decarboxylating 6-phosphogluconate dehydrogenase [Egibacteraceae bacterium]